MTAPQEGADTTMSIPDRQRDPETGRFVDPDPTDRPVRPTAAQARKLYAELDALKAKIAAQAGQLEDAANLAKSRIETLQGRNKEIQQMKAELDSVKLALNQRNAQYNAQETLFSNVRIERDQLKTQVEQLQTSEANLNTNLGLAREDAERADYWKRLAGERADKIGEVAAQAKAASAKLKEDIQGLKAQVEQLQTSEANAPTILNVLQQQLTAISGMIPLELLPTATPPERLAQYLYDLGEMADVWKATADKRQAEIEELEQSLTTAEQARDALQVERDQARADVANLLSATMDKEDSGGLFGLLSIAVVAAVVGGLLRHFAAVWGWFRA